MLFFFVVVAVQSATATGLSLMSDEKPLQVLISNFELMTTEYLNGQNTFSSDGIDTVLKYFDDEAQTSLLKLSGSSKDDFIANYYDATNILTKSLNPTVVQQAKEAFQTELFKSLNISFHDKRSADFQALIDMEKYPEDQIKVAQSLLIRLVKLESIDLNIDKNLKFRMQVLFIQKWIAKLKFDLNYILNHSDEDQASKAQKLKDFATKGNAHIRIITLLCSESIFQMLNPFMMTKIHDKGFQRFNQRLPTYPLSGRDKYRLLNTIISMQNVLLKFQEGYSFYGFKSNVDYSLSPAISYGSPLLIIYLEALSDELKYPSSIAYLHREKVAFYRKMLENLTRDILEAETENASKK